MFGLGVNEGKHYVYGFMDPKFINPLENKKVETQTYITNCLVLGGSKHISHNMFMSKCIFSFIKLQSIIYSCNDSYFECQRH